MAAFRAGGGSEAFLAVRVKQAKVDGLWAAIARSTDVVSEPLPRHQCLHASGLDIMDVHKDIGAAVIRQDEAKSAICVEEFDPPSWHF